MISVNINDTVQHSDITFDHNNVFTSRIMPTFLLMTGACIYLIPCATIVLKLMVLAVHFEKNLIL